MPELRYSSDALRESYHMQYNKKVFDIAKAKAANNIVKGHPEIDTRIVREAIMEEQYNQDFWKYPCRLAPLGWENNSQGPVPWDPEYEAFFHDKERRNDARERAIQQTRIKRKQEDMKQAGTHTRTVRDSPYVGSSKSKDGKGKSKASISSPQPKMVQIDDSDEEDIDVPGPADPIIIKGRSRPSSSGGKPRASSKVPSTSGQGGAGAAAAPISTLLHGTKAMVESMKEPLEVFARYSTSNNHMYCLAVPADQDLKDKIEPLGYAHYKSLITDVARYDLMDANHATAWDIFGSDLGFNTLSLCAFQYKPIPIDPRLTEELKPFVIPFEAAELRSKQLAALSLDERSAEDEDDDALNVATAITNAWDAFSDPSAHVEYWAKVRETARLAELEGTYKASFLKLFNTMSQIEERNASATELIKNKKLTEEQHEQYTNDQITKIMKQGGVTNGKAILRPQFLKHLEIFVGSMPKLFPGDAFSKKKVVDYLDARDKIIEICENLAKPGYIAKLEDEHKQTIPEIIKSEECPGIWALYKRQYEAYNVAKKESEDKAKEASQEKEKMEAEIKERDGEIARLKELLARQAGIQASVGGAADDQDTDDDEDAAGHKRPRSRTRPPTPPPNFVPEHPDKREPKRPNNYNPNSGK